MRGKNGAAGGRFLSRLMAAGFAAWGAFVMWRYFAQFYDYLGIIWRRLPWRHLP